MNGKKWSLLLAFMLVFMLTAPVLSAAADPPTAVVTGISSSNLTAKIVNGNITPAVAEVDIQVKGLTPDSASVILNSGSFSLDAERKLFQLTTTDTGYGFIKKEPSGEYTIHIHNLYYWGDSKILQLDFSNGQTVTVALNQFSTSTITTPDPSPNPIDAHVPYLAGYAVTNILGMEAIDLQAGDRCNLVLQVVDPALPDYGVPIENVCTKINTSAFTCTGLGEISQYDNEQGRYVVLFRDAIYNGKDDKILVDVWYKDCQLPMRTISQAFGVLTSQVEHTPGIVVREINYGASVYAGQPFTLSLTLFSTMGEEDLNDVIVNLTLPEDVSIASGAQSAYVPSMAPKETSVVSFVLTTAANIAKTSVNIGVNITATGEVSYSAVSGSSSITVPVSQPERFEITNIEVPQGMIAGEEQYVTVTYVNKGKKEIDNLSASITGNLTSSSPNQYLGNVPSGTEKTVEFPVMALEPGAIEGTVILTYENNQGHETSLSRAFVIQVEEAPVYDPGMWDEPVMPEQPAGPPVWLYLLVGILAVVGIVVAVRIILRRRAKKAEMLAEAADAAEDEDDTDDYRPIPPAGGAKE